MRLTLACLFVLGPATPGSPGWAAVTQPRPLKSALAKARQFTALELSKAIGLPVQGPPWRPVLPPPPCRVTAAPERLIYDQGEIVRLSGQALDSQGFPVPNVPVVAHVVKDGFDRHIPARPDSGGAYAVAFAYDAQELNAREAFP